VAVVAIVVVVAGGDTITARAPRMRRKRLLTTPGTLILLPPLPVGFARLVDADKLIDPVADVASVVVALDTVGVVVTVALAVLVNDSSVCTEVVCISELLPGL
jgi:hypothetical protein